MGNGDEQCKIPALDGDMTYVQVAAGGYHTVLLRSDGAVVACGWNGDNQCNTPALDGDMTYTLSIRRRRVILQAAFLNTTDATVMQLSFLSGSEHSHVSVLPTDIISDVLA